MSPVVALFGLGVMSELSPFSGEERKLDFGAVRAAFDPTVWTGRALQAEARV